jgi:hypothetical protein
MADGGAVSKYVLVVPFSVGGGVTFALPAHRVSLNCVGATAVPCRQGDRFELRFEEAESTAAARALIARAYMALTSLMLDLRAPVLGSWDVRDALPITPTARQAEFLKGFDGLVDAGGPYVAEAGARIGRLSGNPATVTITVSSERVVSQLERGLASPTAPESFADERLRTAVALHTQAFGQEPPTAALLIRSMVFEALVPSTKKHGVALEFLARWREEVAAERARHEGDPAVTDALDSLSRELLFREESSIRSRLRSFVVRVLGSRSDAADWGQRVRDAYDARSTLLHEGQLAHAEVARASGDLHEAAELVFGTLLFTRTGDAA